MNQPLIVIMGVSGSGKSTIAKLLAQEICVPYFDADDFHPESNIKKMSEAKPLNDDDRTPWLKKLHQLLRDQSNKKGAILACSALKETYRTILTQELKITWIYLKGEADIILNRMNARQHFMPASLLASQFEDLEEPDYSINVSIEKEPHQIIQTIKEKMNTKQSEIGLIGLGVMGKSLSLNMADQGFEVSVFNRQVTGVEEDIAKHFITNNPSFQNIKGFDNLASFITSLSRPRKIFIMVKAGKVIDDLLEEIVPLLEEGDIIMDGGNSLYTDTNRRCASLSEKRIHYLGVGVSGGEKGARFGPAIMPGGDKIAYEKIEKYLTSIAAKDINQKACCTYIGPQGSGHFVKMIHNGIEYAEMQLIAECYDIMRTGMQKSPAEIANIFSGWNEGPSKSYLLEISADILLKKEGEAFLIDLILDKAGNKGTGGWSTKASMDLGTVNSMMASAVFARYVSALKSERIQNAKRFSLDPKPRLSLSIETLHQAYQAARILNHQQGFAIINEASSRFEWDLNLSEISRIWTNGCIIRSSLMKDCIQAFKTHKNMLEDELLFQQVSKSETAFYESLSQAMQGRIATPCLHSAFQYWISYTTETLPANMIQAQRDYFGAHTYRRVDHPESESFHTIWES